MKLSDILTKRNAAQFQKKLLGDIGVVWKDYYGGPVPVLDGVDKKYRELLDKLWDQLVNAGKELGFATDTDMRIITKTWKWLAEQLINGWRPADVVPSAVNALIERTRSGGDYYNQVDPNHLVNMILSGIENIWNKFAEENAETDKVKMIKDVVDPMNAIEKNLTTEDVIKPM